MKVLLVHRYYWPDVTGYAQMLHVMARHLAAQGHEVHVYTSPPSYNSVKSARPTPRRELVDGVHIRRAWMLPEIGRHTILRATNALLFAAKTLAHAVLQRRAYEVMTVSTFPPTIMGLVGRATRAIRRTKLIYHCQDLYPELAWATSARPRQHSLVQRVLRRIDTSTTSKADAVVVLSRDMVATLRARGVDGPHLHVINNFIIEDFAVRETAGHLPAMAEQRFTIIYAGNIGRYQYLDRVLDALALLGDIEDLKIVFIGDGAHQRALEQRAIAEFDTGRVHFRPYMPIKELMHVLSQASLALVSLNPGAIRAAYPSKTMTNLAAGCRILALVEEDSQLAEQVRSHDLGRVCGLRQAPAIADSIRQELARWRTVGFDRDALRQQAQEMFGREQALSAWTRLIESTC